MAETALKRPPMRAIVNPAAWVLVLAYRAAVAREAEMNALVAPIQAQILREVPMFNDLEAGRRGYKPERITDWQLTYLSTDEAAAARAFALADERLKAAGIKPAEMEADFCPALVARTERVDAQRALINATAAPFGLDADALLMRPGMWEEWIALIDQVFP